MDLSEVVDHMGDHEGILHTEYDDISMKSKFALNLFGGRVVILRFDEESFFHTLLGFAP